MAIEQAPLGFPLLSYVEAQTGRTVSGPVAVKLAHAANVVALCRPTKTIRADRMLAGEEFHVGFTRTSPDIPLLLLRWWYRAPDVADTHIAMELTITDSAGNSVGPIDPVIPRAFQGVLRPETPVATTTTAGASNPANLVLGGEGWLDLDDVFAALNGGGTATEDWSFRFIPKESGPTSILFDRVEGFEVPNGIVSDADGAGALSGPLSPGNPVRAGSITTDGWERIQATLQAAAAVRPEYLSLTWPASIALVIPKTSSSGAGYVALTNFEETAGVPIVFRVRIRPMTVAAPPGTNVGELGRFRVFHIVAGGATAKVALETGASVTPAVSGDLTSATWAWSDWFPCRLPTDGSGRIASLSLKGQITTGAGTIYVAGLIVEGDTA